MQQTSRVVNGVTYTRGPDGLWYPQGGQQPVIARPADPRVPIQVDRERVGLQRDQQQVAAGQFDRDIAEANARRAQAEAQRAEAEARRLAEERQGLSEGQQRQNELTQRQALVRRATEAQISAERNFRDYAQGGAPYWLEGWLPTDTNATFDRSGEQLIDATGNLFRVPGQGSQDQREFQALRSARLPQSFQSDRENRQILDYTRAGIDEARAAVGLPPMNWDDEVLGAAPPPPSAPDAPGPRVTGASPSASQEISRDGSSQRVDPALRGAASRIGQMLANGAPDDEIMRYVGESGLGGQTNIDWLLRYRRGQVAPRSGVTFRQWRESNPNRPYPIDPSVFITSQPQGSLTRSLGAAADSVPGAAAAAFSNATIAPAINLFNPNAEQWRAGMGALRNDYPGSTMTGDIAGTIAAYSGGNAALGRAAPGAMARFLSAHPQWAGVGGDAAYGAYRALGENDLMQVPATVGGGMFGRQLVRGAGAAAQGVRDPLVRYLDRSGVTMTLGQMTRRGTGPVARGFTRLEDTMRGFPVVGDLLAARHGEGIEQFNSAAFQQGGRPIGATITGIGHDAAGQGQRATTDAYTNALSGQNFQIDAPFMADWQVARGLAGTVPVVGDDALDVLNGRIGPEFGPGGTLTGEGLQSARQTVRGASPSATASANQQFRYRGVMGEAEDALTGLADRQAPGVMPALRNADAAYRNFSILGDAVHRARNALGDQPFLPSQLGDAAAQNTINFGGRNAVRRGAVPFAQLSEAGRQILPSRLPDSGTAGRAAAGIGVIGALGGAGGAVYDGEDRLGGAAQGSAMSLAGTLALLSPYTRAGARTLQAGLARRSRGMRRIGGYLVNDDGLPQYVGGMFGRTMIPPYIVEDQY